MKRGSTIVVSVTTPPAGLRQVVFSQYRQTLDRLLVLAEMLGASPQSVANDILIAAAADGRDGIVAKKQTEL